LINGTSIAHWLFVVAVIDILMELEVFDLISEEQIGMEQGIVLKERAKRMKSIGTRGMQVAEFSLKLFNFRMGYILQINFTFFLFIHEQSLLC